MCFSTYLGAVDAKRAEMRLTVVAKTRADLPELLGLTLANKRTEAKEVGNPWCYFLAWNAPGRLVTTGLENGSPGLVAAHAGQFEDA